MFAIHLVLPTAAVALALVLIATTVSRNIRRHGGGCDPADGDAIVILGAAVSERGPSTTLRVRLERGGALFGEGRAPLVICSGGIAGGRSEAGAMRDLLIAAGLPADAVVADDGGSNTRAAMLNLARFRNGSLKRILLVSSPYHMYRLAREARRRDLVPIPCPAEPDDPHRRDVTRYLGRQHRREVIAVAWYQTIALLETACCVRGFAIVRSAWRQLFGRLTWLLRDADAVVRAGDLIATEIKLAEPDVTDVTRVLTPDSGISAPLAGRLVHGFGLRYGRLHAGIDLGAPYGTNVKSAAAGKVVVSRPIGPYGNTVVVNHHGGIATVYGHLCGSTVAAGERVAAGEVIGHVGTTGRSSGPHLHFEVRVHGSPVDPAAWLGGEGPGSGSATR